MRRLVVALTVALLSLTLAGCGGGGEDAPTSDAAAPPPPPPPAAAASDVSPIADRSATASETFEPLPGDVLPEEVAKRVETEQAMFLLFYSAKQKQTDDLRRQVDKVAKANRGRIDLLTYDIGRGVSMDKEGIVNVDNAKLSEDEAAKQAVRFARELGVDQTPFLFVVDDQGHIIYWTRGVVDADLLERQVQRAAR